MTAGALKLIGDGASLYVEYWMSCSFEALYHAERLHLVNPAGDVGLVTLWSPLRSARRRLAEISAELLDPQRSRVAVVSNLYGDGMYAMLCNLLFNPQVRHLIAIGQDLGLSTCDELEAFLEHGLEDAVMFGAPVKRIMGTGRVFPATAGFDELRLRKRLSFSYLGKLSSESLPAELMGRLRELPSDEEEGSSVPERLRVDLDAAGFGASSRRPSQPAAHQVVRRRPLDCWEELVVRAVRFGRPVTLSNGPRLELLGAKAVITEPARESRHALERYGFQLESLLDYGAGMLRAELPEDTSYTYGNRLRGHFREQDRPLDTLQATIDRLRANPETRHGYVSLWDNSLDLGARPTDGVGESGEETGSPCLTTLFFRKVGDGLSLTATYRSHNLLTAWLRNVYGLMAIQRHVAERCEMEIGSITVISHSLGIDPSSPHFQLAQRLSDRWRRDDDRDQETGKYSLREDPHGYFVVGVDEREGRIVAEHRFGGVLVKRYSGKRAETIASEISGDMAVSLVSHALWLGRELARHEAILSSKARVA
jgi:Thymidylate synthase